MNKLSFSPRRSSGAQSTAQYHVSCWEGKKTLPNVVQSSVQSLNLELGKPLPLPRLGAYL